MTESAWSGMSVGFWTVLAGLAAVALYLPAIGFDFAYDSISQILIGTFVHRPAHFFDVLTLRVLAMDVLDFNRPANLFSLMVDSLLWGKNPGGYHLTNLLLHGAAAALLFRWILALTARFGPALLASLFFAAHPLLCEAVAEVGNREDLLATLFLLAALQCGFLFTPGSRERWRKIWLPGIGAVAFAFLAVASKESGIAAPASLGVFWLLFRRNDRSGLPNPAHTRGWLLLLGAAGALCGGFLALRFALEPRQSIIFTEHPSAIAPTWGQFLPIQCRIWTAEFLRILWPADLCADYTGYSIRNIGSVAGWLSVAGVVVFQGFLAWRNRLLALGVAVFWFSLLPVSNFIPIYRPMADRFLYMPMTGAALMLAISMAGLQAFLARWLPKAGTPVGVAVAVLLLAGLAARTFREEQIWHDELSLWEATVARNPASFTAQVNLGLARLARHELDQAVAPLKRAAELSKGKDADSLSGLALVADARGRRAEAAYYLGAAIDLDPRYREPEKLVDALVMRSSDAQRLALILLRSKKL